MAARRGTAFIVAVVALALSACAGSEAPAPEGPERLPEVEVREYEGEDLNSVNDFRENSIKGPQEVDIASYRLQVTGLVDSEKRYDYSEITSGLSTYEKVVTLDCVEGWSATVLWEGVLVTDLIDASRPDPSANTVIFRAVDGYTTSLPLDYLRQNDILLAFRMNQITLPAQRGFPFQLVAEDKWGYKWIKWVEEIELSDDPSYRGYWESSGYSNKGDRDSFFYGP